MTDPHSISSDSDLLPPESGALSVPPPVPHKKPGFLRRLFTSRKKQQAVAMQNGYLEMVDLIQAIRNHLDRQETVQMRVLTMLEKVPDAMDRQHEVMSLFKQQLEGNLENDRRLTDSMGKLNGTLSAMDESQKSSSRTITDLIHRSRESEQLLREVMRRAERRMTILLIVFFLLIIGMGIYFVRWKPRANRTPVKVETAAPAKAEEQKAVAEQNQQQKEAAAQEKAHLAAEKQKSAEIKASNKAEKKAKAAEKKAQEAQKQAEEKVKTAEKKVRETQKTAEQKVQPAAEKNASETPALEFTLEHIQPVGSETVPDQPVSLP